MLYEVITIEKIGLAGILGILLNLILPQGKEEQNS